MSTIDLYLYYARRLEAIPVAGVLILYGHRNLHLLPLAITLLVLLHHNAVTVKKSLIPAFSRPTLQPTTQARKIACYGGCGGVHFNPMEQD